MKNSIDTGAGRVKSLDYLRGLMATAIMLYHYYSWTVHHLDSDSTLGRLGVYGVSVFYVLSGLTLYIVYKNSLTLKFKPVLSFWIKRIFRIFPLLWLVITIAIILAHKLPDTQRLILNYTGLFGFIRPQAYIATGQWSIGNELVFYAFFPFFLFLSKKNPPLFYLSILLTIFTSIYFAFVVLNPEQSMAAQWGNYINPLNQLVLFAGGIFIGHVAQFIQAKKYQISIRIILLISILGFIFYPTSPLENNDKIDIVTGTNRMVFVFISYLICFGFYFQNITLPKFIDKPLTLLGEASYSLYLLHPLVFGVFDAANKRFFHLPNIYLAIASGIASFVFSYIVYRMVEQPFIKYGKKLTQYLKIMPAKTVVSVQAVRKN